MKRADEQINIEAGLLADMLDIYWDGTYTPDTPDSEEMVVWLLEELGKPENERRTYGWRASVTPPATSTEEH